MCVRGPRCSYIEDKDNCFDNMRMEGSAGYEKEVKGVDNVKGFQHSYWASLLSR